MELNYISAHIYPLGIDFLKPFLEPVTTLVSTPEEADFILTMNDWSGNLKQSLREAQRWGKPIAWWNIEDPNAFHAFLEQAAQATVVFTSDEACVPLYIQRLGHSRVFWLPLACSPSHHYPHPLSPDATDFVLSANWYENEARLWSVHTVVDPICDADYSLTLFCYRSFMWPERYHRYWQGETSYLSTSQQYAQGRVVLGLNNQTSGYDGHVRTTMTSMRTFEALACKKPFLSSYSEAYERLGFINGEHMVWTSERGQTLQWAERLLTADGEAIAAQGRQAVLDHHTYAHRLKQIAEIMID